MSAELSIPSLALAFNSAPHGVLMTDADEADRLRRIAAPVVAAELRRLADEPGMGFMTGPHDVSAAAHLRARADELDPPAETD